jgi:hypothetical protein
LPALWCIKPAVSNDWHVSAFWSVTLGRPNGFSGERKRLPRGAFNSAPVKSQQFGIPAGRADALVPDVDPVPLPELPEAVLPDPAEPVVLPDDDPEPWFLSRAMLVLTSQH